ncbi:hypothetical protein DFR40_0338 [Azonexus fungiphilus]|uniref:Uncharacterized protein n=1 Tax=Azonexus fungiphilus TaxID=146940 RepID=A0A495WKZ2_9RHOO|nr:hypothetical protein [Azonexus fungiphilus]NHC08034.1 hypothetical protein [Azonexus fungiphilus]RKT62451.1 hypothetical protein DFR40_0338 [Azonexus fungiphilus]
MTHADLRKKREILFSKFPPGQVPEAADDLKHLDEIDVEPKFEKRALGVEYELTQHTLAELEDHLEDKGYHLDNTLMSKLTRALIHYVEETQLHNMVVPEKRLKPSPEEAYVKAWETRPHGDHDDTPPEWREYK